ncbi:MAG: sulfatase-like hydrolase/transferase, partial [Myxococcales bacterium]|nr:sulfatase-like hydrolase/transferase [Myxococcales bacterium]
AEAGPPPALRQAPGTTLRAYVYLPRDARLRTAVAALDERGGTAAVRAVPDGGEPLELLAPATLRTQPEDLDLDLGPLAGRAVRLEFAVTGPGGVRWVAPRVVVPDRSALPPEPRTARNLVVLLVDTLRADKLREIDASSEVDAQNLLRWAREGTTFTRAVAQENWTKPSVATLLTGLYPSSHAAQSERAVLPPEARLLSEYLHDEGFATACFIANGYVSDTFGFRRGWDLYRNYVRGGLPNRAQHVFADAAAWIAERKPEERFFVFVQTIDPHVPYIPPREFLDRYDADPYSGPVKAAETSKLLERIKAGQVTLTARDRRRLEALYDGEITYHDAHAPKLYEALESLGVLDDTLVVVTADHGEEFFEHGSVGHGHSLYQELLHVPLLLRLPGRFRAAAKVDAVAGLVDVAPTAFEALGLGVPPAFQGRSLLALAHDGETGVETAFSEFLEGQRAVTGQRYKLIHRGYRPLLYDLREDPGEVRDAAGEQPIAARTMQIRLARYLEWQERAGRDELRPRGTPEAEIDPQLEAQLRALGYLGGPP